MFNENMPSLSDIAAVTDGNRNGFGGDGWWAIIILFALFGWGGNAWGGNQGRTVESGAIAENYALTSDMASIERRIDGIDEHLCDGFLNATQVAANNFAAVNQAITSGFDNTNQNIMANGYENRLGQSQLQMQAAQNNCAVLQAIGDNTTQGVINTNLLQGQLAQNGFAAEKATMQTRFDAQQYNCNTLQAIDALGDRIINQMNADKMQDLRDQNQALRLAASQSAQNQYLVNQLRPAPVPAFTVPNPWNYNGLGFGALS